tara:strand:- start:363 stop:536 length:174 start_codon:yes stop_codon:yes gene_type:complete
MKLKIAANLSLEATPNRLFAKLRNDRSSSISNKATTNDVKPVNNKYILYFLLESLKI